MPVWLEEEVKDVRCLLVCSVPVLRSQGPQPAVQRDVPVLGGVRAWCESVVYKEVQPVAPDFGEESLSSSLVGHGKQGGGNAL